MKKYITVVIPFIVLWSSFGIAHFLEIKESSWWAVPYVLTSLAAIIFSAVLTTKLYEYYERKERGW